MFMVTLSKEKHIRKFNDFDKENVLEIENISGGQTSNQTSNRTGGAIGSAKGGALGGALGGAKDNQSGEHKPPLNPLKWT